MRKEKYLFNMRGWAGPAPCPIPPLRWRSRGGGGGMSGQALPGGFEQGRGDIWQASRELKWQIFLASKFGGLFSRVNLADFHVKIFWRVVLAHLFGGSFWHIYLAGFHSHETSKLKRKEKEMYNQ